MANNPSQKTIFAILKEKAFWVGSDFILNTFPVYWILDFLVL